jgi:hypothetical protein
MDEKRLDEIAPEAGIMGAFSFEDMVELIRLARLGLWAEKHGIPAIRWEDKRCGRVYGPLGEALAALPKERDDKQ